MAVKVSFCSKVQILQPNNQNSGTMKCFSFFLFFCIFFVMINLWLEFCLTNKVFAMPRIREWLVYIRLLSHKTHKTHDSKTLSEPSSRSSHHVAPDLAEASLHLIRPIKPVVCTTRGPSSCLAPSLRGSSGLAGLGCILSWPPECPWPGRSLTPVPPLTPGWQRARVWGRCWRRKGLGGTQRRVSHLF